MLKGNWKKKICTVEMYLVLQEKCEWFKPQNLMLAPVFIHCVSCKVSVLFVFLKVLCVWIVPSTLENLSRFVLPCHLVVKLNWWNSIKNFWAWLHASSVVAGCLKLSIYLHPLIHFSVLGQGLEPIPAVIQQDAEYTLHRSPTPIYCKWDDSVNNCTKMLLSTFKPQI